MKRVSLVVIFLMALFLAYEISYPPVKQAKLQENIRLNLLEASFEEIKKLPFIGDKKAEQIILLRHKGSLWRYELESIVGKKVFAKISSQITFSKK